ncbi:hypothetical protein LVD13_08390 [Flavobacteriaceae bacterium D16]|nr:hypothetical protein [Flavobacteriaceae bacterium D16]
MLKTRKHFIIALIIVVVGFSVGIYLQDLKHKESTEAAWSANRYNMTRFYKIRDYTIKMDSSNWNTIRDSIGQELDSFMILRFRKEVDSLNELNMKGEYGLK